MAKSSEVSARSIAVQVLTRVLADRAYAGAALDAELVRYPQLDSRDRGLVTEIVYGVLRTEPALERELRRHAARVDKKDTLVYLNLLVAAYQLAFLDRVPAFAAVDAAVGSVRAKRGPRVAGFVNAVLRKLAKAEQPLDFGAACLSSAPVWLRERLAAQLSEEEMRLLLAGSREPPALSVRVVAGKPLPEWLASAPPGRVSPRARIVSGDARRLDGHASGAFVVQEEGAQLVALALGARPGERVLDACAGRGQKSSLLAEQIGPRGELWVSDVHPAKLTKLGLEFERLGLPAPKSAAVDWSQGVGGVPDGFDRVLVDAPCTGSGTLRRRPEILRRLTPEDPLRLAQLSELILRHAATRARPGGRVVFAVCSVLQEECEAVMERVADVLCPVPFDAPELEALGLTGTSSFRLTPLRHGTDGYFVASLTPVV